MKLSSWTFVTWILAIVTLCACGGGSTKVETKKLQQTFQGASADLKGEIDKAVAAIQAGNLAGAVAPFKAVAQKGGLSQEQKDAIVEVVAEMQVIASQDPKNYPAETYRAISEIVPMLEGQTPAIGKPALP